MSKSDMLNVYKTVIRPSVEYCAVVYHSLIPGYMSDKLEQVQRQALRIIYGWEVDIVALIENGTIEELSKRREDNSKKFALKALSSERFGGRWFPRNNSQRKVRGTTRRNFKEKNHKTDRARNNLFST